MDSNWVDSFKGQHITIITMAGSEERTDTGTLVHMEGGWLQMLKDNGDNILVPSTAVRLIKLLNMGQRNTAVQVPTTPNINTRVYGSDEPLNQERAPDERAVL